ncbi:MAG: hypothetical protein A2514_07890 [Gammaproteobacteria bacterium RIFOXYD12_FULL_61_37]|nr:MAG: hypothetical protein A2514_07890 [Gammaproteobacteria bacterium RIFOXYD12_FULL_61_37]
MGSCPLLFAVKLLMVAEDVTALRQAFQREIETGKIVFTRRPPENGQYVLRGRFQCHGSGVSFRQRGGQRGRHLAAQGVQQTYKVLYTTKQHGLCAPECADQGLTVHPVAASNLCQRFGRTGAKPVMAE